MSVRRDTPRGPTSEQLRRRALAHEQRARWGKGDTLSFAPVAEERGTEPRPGSPLAAVCRLRNETNGATPLCRCPPLTCRAPLLQR